MIHSIIPFHHDFAVEYLWYLKSVVKTFKYFFISFFEPSENNIITKSCITLISCKHPFSHVFMTFFMFWLQRTMVIN